MNNKDAVKRVLNYLGRLGQAKYHSYNMDDGNFNWAGLELTTKLEIVEELEEYINSRLTLEAGFRANLIFIEWGEKDEKVFRYMAEIVPLRDERGDIFIPRQQWEGATEEVLRALPKILKNYRMQRKNNE
jgi:hypothetical protein